MSLLLPFITKKYVDDQDTALDAANSVTDQAYTDTKDAANSVTDQAYTDTREAALKLLCMLLDGTQTMTGLLDLSASGGCLAVDTGGQFYVLSNTTQLYIGRNVYNSGGWKAKNPWNDATTFKRPMMLFYDSETQSFKFQISDATSGAADDIITWQACDINVGQITTSGNETVSFNEEALAYLGTNQSLTSGVSTLIQLDTESHDYGSNFNTTSPYDYEIPATGLYDVVGGAAFSSNNTGARILGIGVNGSVGPFRTEQVNQQSTNHYMQVHGGSRLFTIGDLLDLRAVQYSGGALNILAGIDETFLSVRRVR